MKPDPKDRDEKERREQDERVPAKDTQETQNKNEFQSRVDSIIERYRPALEELAR